MENTIHEWDNKKMKNFLRKDLLLRTICRILCFFVLCLNIFVGNVMFHAEGLRSKIIFCSCAILSIISIACLVAITPRLFKKVGKVIFTANCGAIILSVAQTIFSLLPVIKKEGLFTVFNWLIHTTNDIAWFTNFFILITLLYVAISSTLFFLKKFTIIREQVTAELDNRTQSGIEKY